MIYDLSHPDLFNPIFLPLHVDDNRIIVDYGGRDSGKSDDIASIIVSDIMTQDYYRAMLLRRYFADIRDSQFQTIKDCISRWGLNDEFHITESPLKIVYKRNPNNYIIAKGLDKSDATKSKKDITVMWAEEANQISQQAFIDSNLSIRSSMNRNYKFYLTFNPEQESAWINSYFFPPKGTYEKDDGNFHWVKSIRPNTTILHTTYHDNKFCDPYRAAELESLASEDNNYYRVKTLGLWGGALKGLIYDNWKPCEAIPEGAEIAYGLDYGFSHPSALVKVGFHENQTYVEQLIYRSNLTHPDLIDLILTDYRSELKGKVIIVDSAAPEVIALMKSAGLDARPCLKGPTSVYDGILTVKRFPINIVGGSSEVRRELGSYIWKRTRDDLPMDEPVKLDDHAMDAIRYVLYTWGRRYWFRKLYPDQKSNRTPRERKPRNTFYGI